MNSAVAYGQTTLDASIRSRFVKTVTGLEVHVLEAGDPNGPAILLLHGFPELAYSWRKVIPALAAEGYHVLAPDQRGYGRTTGWDGRFDGDLDQFRMTSFVRDALALVNAFGHRTVEMVVGHDYGSPVAGWSALIRPDVFKRLVLMSAPFPGGPALPFDTHEPPDAPDPNAVDNALRTLPRPRKHYRWYYSTAGANANMWHAPDGVAAFMRAYYHHKSADWPGNTPHPVASWAPEVMAEMPTYYIMDAGMGMAETVAAEMPDAETVSRATWLTDDELAVYAEEYGRNGFQGGLQSYRCGTNPEYSDDLRLFAGRTVDVPSRFISGASDWGTYQSPGTLERMQAQACTDFRGIDLVPGAGHWVQQEQPEAVADILLQHVQCAIR